jgi:hypothetical protein
MSPLPTHPQGLPLRVFALHRQLRQVLYHAQNSGIGRMPGELVVSVRGGGTLAAN